MPPRLHPIRHRLCAEGQLSPQATSHKPDSYDVIIIGAGSVGAPAALAMARDGLKVLVIDSLPSQGQGSNKAAIGGVRATHSDPAKIRLGLRTLEIMASWQEAYGHDIEWREGGYVFVAYREEEERKLRELLKVQHAQGLAIDWYDADALLGIVPDLEPRGLRGGTYAPHDGHCSPLLAGHAYCEQAQRYGAEFRFREQVTDIMVDKGRVRGVVTDKGRYSAPVVVNAAGPWARRVGLMVGHEHPVWPDAHEAGVTEAVAHFLDPMVVDIRPVPGSANFYFHQLATGQLTFCITPDPPIWGEDRRETSRFLPEVSRRMVGLMPRLGRLRVRRTWRGLYPMTPDGSPLVGWLDEPRGYLVAIGMCGQGVMLGPGLGELLARTVAETLGAEDREVLTELSPSREFAAEEALK